MEDLKEKTVDLADHVEDLASTFYRLTVVKVTEKTSNIVSGAVVMIVMCALGLFVLLFAGCALAWWLGNLVHSRVGGFFISRSFLFYRHGNCSVASKEYHISYDPKYDYPQNI